MTDDAPSDLSDETVLLPMLRVIGIEDSVGDRPDTIIALREVPSRDDGIVAFRIYRPFPRSTLIGRGLRRIFPSLQETTILPNLYEITGNDIVLFRILPRY